jgi:hypothetical protein
VRWFDSIDLTCERTDASFWAEPWNAGTSLLFVLASLFVAWRAYRAGELTPAAIILSGFGVATGVSSFLTHSLARQWTEVATMGVTAIFVGAAMAVALVRFFGLSRAVVLYVVALFGVMSGLAAIFLPSEGLDGHAVLVPAVVVLLVVVAALRLWGRHALAVLEQPKNRAVVAAFGPTMRAAAEARRNAGRQLLMAAVALTLALLMSSVDGQMCDSLPLSLHFLSHLSAAVAMVFVLDAVLRSGALARPIGSADSSTGHESEREGHEERGR